eukprot:1863828-Amphidinium_carterae.1
MLRPCREKFKEWATSAAVINKKAEGYEKANDKKTQLLAKSYRPCSKRPKLQDHVSDPPGHEDKGVKAHGHEHAGSL